MKRKDAWEHYWYLWSWSRLIKRHIDSAAILPSLRSQISKNFLSNAALENPYYKTATHPISC